MLKLEEEEKDGELAGVEQASRAGVPFGGLDHFQDWCVAWLNLYQRDVAMKRVAAPERHQYVVHCRGSDSLYTNRETGLASS